MKKLLILRHAQALGTAIGGSDKTRKLSPNGTADAKALGVLMAKGGLQPDAVLCSAATRTRETLGGVMDALDAAPIDYLDRLYNADYRVLMDAVQEVPSEAQVVLLVAHNPGVHQLAARLAFDDGSERVDRLSTDYAPATLTVLQCDITDWADLKEYANVVKAVHETVEYNASDRPTRWM
ncbi:MAG: hypothetical protein GW778_07870 [Alphaproteobacteria bacterium]|nr:hypothetical protein [Alphaproteobacteria bacterium]